jgi:hypothetical protein
VDMLVPPSEVVHRNSIENQHVRHISSPRILQSDEPFSCRSAADDRKNYNRPRRTRAIDTIHLFCGTVNRRFVAGQDLARPSIGLDVCSVYTPSGLGPRWTPGPWSNAMNGGATGLVSIVAVDRAPSPRPSSRKPAP